MVGRPPPRDPVGAMTNEIPPRDDDETTPPEEPPTTEDTAAPAEPPTTEDTAAPTKPPTTADTTPPAEPPTTEARSEEAPTAEQPPREDDPSAYAAGSGGGGGAGARPTAAAGDDGPTGPRRLYRSKDDRLLWGVCGGIAEFFGIDPVLVRVAAVALVFAGGAGLILYFAALLLVPVQGEDGEPPKGPSRGLAIAGIIVLVIAVGSWLPWGGDWWFGWSIVPLGFLALAGLIVWRVASGEGPRGDARSILRAIGLGLALIVACGALAIGAGWAAAAGGGNVIAGIVIAAGLALVAGAFLGPRVRWLILPAIAVALPAGVVAAADIDVHGGYGTRTYSPATSSEVRDSYRMGAGKLVVDLRRANLTPGDHPIKLDLGVGEAQLVVPPDVCVSTDSHLGIGGVQVFDRDSGGIDVDWADERTAPASTPRVLVDANVGLGAFTVHHDEDHGWRHDDPGNGACG
jgi:phage shock protein PspC (stress-responsive transcriptional regulator)